MIKILLKNPAPFLFPLKIYNYIVIVSSMKMSRTGGETFTLTAQEIDKLIRAGSSDAALLYLYILRTHGQSTDKQAAEALGKSKGWIADAMAMLSRMRLIEIDAAEAGSGGSLGVRGTALSGAADDASDAPVAEPRAYTQDEVVREIESGSDFTIVVEETARRLGKPLSPDETLRLYGIYHDLRLPTEVILQLITHCINECRNSGDGRMPSVRYIEKAAFTWEREGIFSIERAEEYLKALEARKSARGKIKQVLQIRNREFSETERHFVDGWIKMGFETDVIALAYDKTVVNTGALSYPYMDTILKKWDAKGLHTAQEVQEKDSRSRGGGYQARTGRGGPTGGQKHGEPTREQMEHMSRLLEKMEE